MFASYLATINRSVLRYSLPPVFLMLSTRQARLHIYYDLCWLLATNRFRLYYRISARPHEV